MYLSEEKDKEYELSPEELSKLQKMDAIKTDEEYDIDLEEKKNASPSVEEEKLIPSPPPDMDKKEKDFYSDIDDKYTLSEDEIPPEEIPEEQSVETEDIPEEEPDNKEYLNRHQTIFGEPSEIPKKEKKQKMLPPAKKAKKKNNYSDIMTLLAILVCCLFVVFLFLVFWNLTSKDIDLTDTQKESVVEMSQFLAYNEEYIDGINELSDQKKVLIESYIKGIRNKKELALDLLAIKNKESQISDLYNENLWTFESVNTADAMTREFINSNMNLTQNIVNMLGDKAEKGQILDIYNDTVKTHTSQLYTINEYVKGQVSQLGVNVVVEDNVIQIDLSNIKDLNIKK